MIKYCGKRKEIQDTLWSVFTSFAYKEIEKDGACEKIEETGKFCWFESNEAAALNIGNIGKKSYAEAVALCVEASIACGLDNFEITVSDVLVYDLLILFGFEKMVKMGDTDGFKAISGGKEFAKGCFKEERCCCKFNIPVFMEVLKEAGIDMTESTPSASLIYAEKNAEGLAYDVAYNLRVNGCIIEYYNLECDIESACKYATEKGFSCVIRALADGTLQIKDLIKDEITETNVQEFLGYYDDADEEEECSCGHHHEHGECCGHHHEHDDDCCCGKH